jgi:hypothetical protein
MMQITAIKRRMRIRRIGARLSLHDEPGVNASAHRPEFKVNPPLHVNERTTFVCDSIFAS